MFEKAGIPVPRGSLCTSADQAKDVAEKMGKSVVVKAQVLVAGRGKAGGVKLAGSPDEAFSIANSLLGSEIKGIKVHSVLVVEAVEAKKELYLGFAVDRARRKIALIASAEGGIDLEELAKTKPDMIFREEIDPILGLFDFEARNAAASIGLKGNTAIQFSSICRKVYSIFAEQEADLTESNPLAIKEDGSLIALDARITLDDNAIFRHEEFGKQIDEDQTPLEVEAQQSGLAFVQLNGDIGIIGNGAGLVMASLDVIAYYGGRPANFLDMGGGSKAEEVYKAVRVVLEQNNLKSVFVNILGGITKCDEVATGLVKALNDSKSQVPFTVRMVGTNEEEGRKILDSAGIAYLDSMESAAQTAVRVAGESRPVLS